MTLFITAPRIMVLTELAPTHSRPWVITTLTRMMFCGHSQTRSTQAALLVPFTLRSLTTRKLWRVKNGRTCRLQTHTKISCGKRISLGKFKNWQKKSLEFRQKKPKFWPTYPKATSLMKEVVVTSNIQTSNLMASPLIIFLSVWPRQRLLVRASVSLGTTSLVFWWTWTVQA